MQDVPSLHTAALSDANTAPRVIPWSLAITLVLILLAGAVYLAALDSAAMTPDEASAALSAYRFADRGASGADTLPTSPLVFLAQSLSFTLLGNSEGAARIATALAGIGLVLVPLLLRGLLGSSRALLLSAVLLCSPVLIAAARSSSPAVWSALLAGLFLWAAWRWYSTEGTGYAVAAAVFAGMLLFLSEPAGILLALILLGSFAIARLTAPRDDEDLLPPALQSPLSNFPWTTAIPGAALIVLALATLFLLYPQGLTAVGDLLARFVGGFVNRDPSEPALFPLAISFFYELFLWVLGLAVILWMALRYRPPVTFVDRFCAAWLLLGALAAALYPGARAEHALWLTLPLAGLVSRLAPALFEQYDPDQPRWARWLVALAGLGILAMGSLALQGLSRSLPRFASSGFSINQIDALNIVILGIVLAFVVVGYFLVRSFWETDSIPLRAAALALLSYTLITGVGSGWQIAVSGAENPIELWHREAPSRDAYLLRETLFDVAGLTNKGFAEMPLSVLSAGDPLIEWAVRDFRNAQFIDTYTEALNTPVLLAAALTLDDRTPPLEGAYLGQDFVLQRAWPLSSLSGGDLIAWWTHRHVTNTSNVPRGAILWVRADVYAGSPTVIPGP